MAAVRAEHDQVDVALVGDLRDPPPGRCRFGGHAPRAEAGLPGELGTVRRGLLRGLLYLAGLRGVEMQLADGHEADIRRLPDAEDERVAPAGGWPAGLVDRELRELRAVVGEQDQAVARDCRLRRRHARAHVRSE